MSPVPAEAPAPLDTDVAVLVLRRSPAPFQHCSLGIARSLGRLGVPVHCVTWGRREAAMRSRYVASTLPLDPQLSDERWVDGVLRMGDAVGRALLLPIDDRAAITVGDQRARLNDRFLLPSPPAGIERRLASKHALHELCVELGLDTPRWSVPQSEAELLSAAAARGYPVVLKRGDPWLAPRDPGAPSVFIAHTPDEARRAYAAMESDERPQVMVQEYIPGDSDTIWMVNAYVGADGRAGCAFTGRKLRQRGPRTGPTTLGECRHNEVVLDAARTLFDALGYRGIVDMGFRFDARDGRYKLLDVNPRIGSTFRLFEAQNGLDVVRAMHLDLTGRPVPAATCRDGRRWIDERSDPICALRLGREGSLGLRDWMRSLRGIDEAAWWAADDPRPFALMCTGSSLPAVRRMTGKAHA